MFGEKCREMFAMTCYRRNDSEQMWMSMTSKAELGGVDRTLVRAYSRLNSMNGMYEFGQKETARPPTLILVRIERTEVFSNGWIDESTKSLWSRRWRRPGGCSRPSSNFSLSAGARAYFYCLCNIYSPWKDDPKLVVDKNRNIDFKFTPQS